MRNCVTFSQNHWFSRIDKFVWARSQSRRPRKRCKRTSPSSRRHWENYATEWLLARQTVSPNDWVKLRLDLARWSGLVATDTCPCTRRIRPTYTLTPTHYYSEYWLFECLIKVSAWTWRFRSISFVILSCIYNWLELVCIYLLIDIKYYHTTQNKYFTRWNVVLSSGGCYYCAIHDQHTMCAVARAPVRRSSWSNCIWASPHSVLCSDICAHNEPKLIVFRSAPASLHWTECGGAQDAFRSTDQLYNIYRASGDTICPNCQL